MRNTCIMILLAMVLALSACSSAQEGKALFEQKCVKCHPLEKSLNETKDLAGWEKTTKAMIRYSDGDITQDDAKKIAQYLAGIRKN